MESRPIRSLPHSLLMFSPFGCIIAVVISQRILTQTRLEDKMEITFTFEMEVPA
jgi:hypothetical protein